MDHREQLPIGAELVGDYRIDGVLGQGGFGITYKAWHLGLKAPVAVKEYFPTEFATRDNTLTIRPKSERHGEMFDWGRKRFLEEAQTLEKFRHPSIVRVRHVFEALNTAYMVLEYEDGQSLRQWLDDLGRPVTQAELDGIVSPLLDALAEMHAADFIHRDIAPDNIIIRPDGSPVLLDFGAARQAIAAETKTLTGIVKAGYSPPEQYLTDARLQGAWTDIYALGATLYRAVMGEAPPEAPARQIDTTLVPAATASQGEYRPAFLDALDWALKLKIEKRPQSVSVFQDALSGRQGGSETVAMREAEGGKPRLSESAPVSPTPPAPRRNRGESWKWMAVLLLGMVGGIGGYVAYDHWQAERAAQARKAEEARRRAEGRIEVLVGLPGREQTRLLKPGAGKTEWFKDCPDCPEMVVVPAGAFMMGSPKSEAERLNTEGPRHQVKIATPVAIGRFEVTFDEWDACMAVGGCKHRPGDRGWGRGRRPVINVNWADAKQYVAWLSKTAGKRYRLLSEAEWEYTARAGTTTPFWWGSSISTDQANYDGNYTYGDGSKGTYRKRTVKVDSFKPNPWGLYQVHGNVWEWVADCWNKSYAGASGDGSPWTSGDCDRRVLRGGSWISNPRDLRSASRDRYGTDDRYYDNGFRVARTLTP